ncbi:hypothetical protein ACP70R_001040 [Stipagrostis hirtigluma subsp. patula]
MASTQQKACIGLVIVGIVVALGFVINWFVVNMAPPYVTVSLLSARGIDAHEQTRTTPVEFDVAIGFSHLHSFLAAGHDGGHVTITYAGVKLAEGPVPKFYVAGGPKWVEAAKAVASAGEDQAPLPQVFRDHIWVDQQLDGEAEFDVVLSFSDVNITTGETRHSYHSCRAGLVLEGKAKPSKCGKASYFLRG